MNAVEYIYRCLNANSLDLAESVNVLFVCADCSVCFKWAAKHWSRWEVEVPWGGVHEWRKAEQGDWYVEWESKHSSAWALSFCGDKTELLNIAKLSVLKSVCVCTDPYLWSRILGNDWKNTIPSASSRDGIFAKSLHGVIVGEKVCSYKIREALNIEPLLLIERPQLL